MRFVVLAALLLLSAAAYDPDDDAARAAHEQRLADLRAARAAQGKKRKGAAQGPTWQEEMDAMRHNRTWGRLYTERSARSMQYFKGTFGGREMPRGMLPVVRAEPFLACANLTNAAEAAGALVLVQRGNCTFADKARQVQGAAAAAMLVENSDDDMLHPPGGGDADDVTVPVALVSKSSGRLLRHALDSGMHAEPLRAATVPIWCHRDGGSSVCEPTNDQETRIELDAGRGGHVSLLDLDESFEYVPAEFGGPAPTEPLELVLADPPSACDPLENAEAVAGKAVVVRRGDCSFVDKAHNAAEADAAAVVFVNSGPCLFRAPAERSWEGSRIPVPVVMVSSAAAAAVERGGRARLSPGTVDARQWHEAAQYFEPEQWPSSKLKRAALLATLRADHEGSPERAACVEAGAANVEAFLLDLAGGGGGGAAEAEPEADADVGEEFEL